MTRIVSRSNSKQDGQNLLLWAIATDRRRHQAVAGDVVEDRAIVATLIFVLFGDGSLLNPFAILFVLSVGTFKFEYLQAIN